MTAVSGTAAAQRLLSFGVCRPGYCLYYVWQAYKSLGASTDLPAPTAYDGWLGSAGKHEGDRNPPAGVPVYFGPKAGSRAGDVVISLGGGLVAATDWPYSGIIGITTIDARQRQISRPYLGWTETILNHPIDYAGVSPAPTPVTSEENPDMPVFIDNSFIINWPNGYTNVYDPRVFQVIRWVAKGQTTEAWAVEIFVSESWKAARELDRILKGDDAAVTIDARSVDAVAAAVKLSVDDLSARIDSLEQRIGA